MIHAQGEVDLLVKLRPLFRDIQFIFKDIGERNGVHSLFVNDKVARLINQSVAI
ncbi:hypothetical protein RZ517_03415 [Roseovarius sp. S88]|uniref:Uncharacterized protein n=1 Tax=Roseovarius phycicola TaxID=3080976 RepID=A0ABZ2HJ00_9RHOB|nr:hypothetical protein [Roseovarius sp. W115]